MPRPAKSSSSLQHAVGGLVAALATLVERLGAATTGERPSGARGPGKGNPRLKAALKASWAKMTPAERRARVAKMLAGRGLSPKRAPRKPARARPRAPQGGATVTESPVPPSIVI